jgi:hypothetical protein
MPNPAGNADGLVGARGVKQRNKGSARALSNTSAQRHTQKAAKVAKGLRTPQTNTHSNNENISIDNPNVSLEVCHGLGEHPQQHTPAHHPQPTPEPFTPAGARLPVDSIPVINTLTHTPSTLPPSARSGTTRSATRPSSTTDADTCDADPLDVPQPQTDFEASLRTVTPGERALWDLPALVKDIEHVARCPACNKGERVWLKEILDLERHRSEGVARLHPLAVGCAIIWVISDRFYETYLESCCVNCVNLYHIYKN